MERTQDGCSAQWQHERQCRRWWLSWRQCLSCFPWTDSSGFLFSCSPKTPSPFCIQSINCTFINYYYYYYQLNSSSFFSPLIHNLYQNFKLQLRLFRDLWNCSRCGYYAISKTAKKLMVWPQYITVMDCNLKLWYIHTEEKWKI